MNDFLSEWHSNEAYFKMLKLMGSLSNLFSESDIPFIHYRVTENLFCKYFNAENLSRTDTAYDAKIGRLGIGIKTFQLKSSTNSSTEKIAEFNALSPELRLLSGKNLALRLAQYRNERMSTANRLYGIDNQIYHVIGRRKNRLAVFNTPYDPVEESEIHDIIETAQSLHFKDSKNEYTYNKSKSVLMKKFVLPEIFEDIAIDIIADPYSALEQLISHNDGHTASLKEQKPQVYLPLFSTRKAPAGVPMNSAGKWVPEKSGLNQWNASGRPRDINEIYIPVPRHIHEDYPNFFPSKDTPFTLHLPDGGVLKAKICQAGDKALMSNPNKALGEWILRKVLLLNERELLTIEKLDAAGFDTVAVTKNGSDDYSIDVYYSSSDENNGQME
ncbi:MAG: hypothetical protein NC127_04685 [Muribaculum sp.]|nr:hypothetical protein [Muribaculum sp.]